MLWGGGGIAADSNGFFIIDGSTKVTLSGKWTFKTDLETLIPKIHNYHKYPYLLYNEMIQPLIPYGIKGWIWDQGESNVTAASKYRYMFPMLINDWRQKWKQGNLPFLFVQLLNFKQRVLQPSESELAELREAQAMTLSIPKTAMVCSIDLGDSLNIHPKNKKDIGSRLALVVAEKVYQHHLNSSGPSFQNFKISNQTIQIKFNTIGRGFLTADGKAIRGFSIAGNDKKFFWQMPS